MPKSIIVYDFDKTIYDGDSSIDFWKFCLVKYPKLIIYLPKTISTFVLYIAKLRTKKQLKESFFKFLSGIPDVEQMVDMFWQASEQKLKPSFIQEITSKSLIISASPEFLLQPLTKKLGANLIASQVSTRDGKFLSENCYGVEKVHRLQDEMPNVIIDKFYSDSYSDTPLAEIANQAFLVSKDEIVPWAIKNLGDEKQ